MNDRLYIDVQGDMTRTIGLGRRLYRLPAFLEREIGDDMSEANIFTQDISTSNLFRFPGGVIIVNDEISTQAHIDALVKGMSAVINFYAAIVKAKEDNVIKPEAKVAEPKAKATKRRKGKSKA